MPRAIPRRQKIRRALILVSLLLFPITMNYMSPYVIIDGASQGILAGSPILFSLLFLSALFLGRAWCGWVCPAAGLGEAAFAIVNKPARGGKWNGIKWLIWVPWISLVVYLVLSAGGYRRVDFFYLTEKGVSVTDPQNYVIYLTVVGIFMLLALLTGRRGGCHYICWMAPFMIIGRKIRHLGRWPALRLVPETAKCTACKRCTRECPMSLDVTAMVQRGDMEHSECILCGSCVDTCPNDVIRYVFAAGR